MCMSGSSKPPKPKQFSPPPAVAPGSAPAESAAGGASGAFAGFPPLIGQPAVDPFADTKTAIPSGASAVLYNVPTFQVSPPKTTHGLTSVSTPGGVTPSVLASTTSKTEAVWQTKAEELQPGHGPSDIPAKWLKQNPGGLTGIPLFKSADANDVQLAPLIGSQRPGTTPAVDFSSLRIPLPSGAGR